ncbi:MAG: protein kinase [Prevotella sp.]|nr:protein kinase [Prevotella sp.]
MNDTSEFFTDSFEGISREFTDIQPICESGTSRLYRATRFGRLFVLKTLATEALRQSMYREMLRKELEIIMQLQHPGIVQAVGLETVEGIGQCIVMEFIDGATLTDYIEGERRGTLSEEQRRHIVDDLISAVGYLHSKGIIHRDLKPENIMIAHNGLQVKVIDFGMADTDSHTTLKQPAGTLRYMAPEQTTAYTPDVRNDIYSLGLILQDLDLGKPYRPIIERCLRPIDQRYANINELRNAIDSTLASRHRRRQWLIAGASALCLLTLGALAVWLFRPSNVNEPVTRTIVDRHATDSLREVLARQQAENAATQAEMEAEMATRMGTMRDSIAQLHAESQRLQEELNRVSTAKTQAIQAFDRAATKAGIIRELDTLRHWQWHSADLSQRIQDMNRFVYNYVDALDARFSASDRDKVREALLEHWQQWNNDVEKKIKTLRNKERG